MLSKIRSILGFRKSLLSQSYNENEKIQTDGTCNKQDNY